jgi:hypothetical protein
MKTYFVTNKLDDDGKSIEAQYLNVYEEYNSKEIAAGRRIAQTHTQLETTNRNLGMGFREVDMEKQMKNGHDSNDDENTLKEKKKRKELLKNSTEIRNKHLVKNDISNQVYNEIKASNVSDFSSGSDSGDESNNDMKTKPKLKALTQKHLIGTTKSSSKSKETETLNDVELSNEKINKQTRVTFSNHTTLIPKKTSTTCRIV